MSDNGLVLAWGVPVRGREQKALEVFMEAQEMYAKAEAGGAIAGFETVIMQPTGGGLPGGHTIAWGDEGQVDSFERSDEFVRIVQRASLIVEGVGVTRCMRGAVLMEGMGQYSEAIASLT